MKRGIQQGIKDAFAAPKPLKKQEFLQKISYSQVCHSEISFGRFMWQQASYIRKRAWASSFIIFMVALIGGCFMEKDVLWLLSAMMPFLAITAIAENIRSEIYGMFELEMATRFSLKSVVLARMGVLGVLHSGTLCLITILGWREGATDVFQTGVYLLVPYLLTDVGGLWLVRKIRGREAVYASMVLAFVIGAFPVISRYAMTMLYGEQYFGWWLTALAVLSVGIVSEWKKNLKRTEELEWSL